VVLVNVDDCDIVSALRQQTSVSCVILHILTVKIVYNIV